MEQPILCDEGEMMRLHSLAHTTAIQTGAKGYELDQVTAGIFSMLIAQNNRGVMHEAARPQLRLIEG